MPTDFGDPDETVEMSGPVNLEAWAPPAAGAASEPLGDLASSSDALACEPPPMLGPAPQPPPDLDEWLFDQSMEIGLSPSIPEAGRRALQILLDLVKCDAGSVLFATYGMDALQFIAAAGPEAAKLREVTVPVDRSIAGFAFRSGFSFVVQDAMADDRHMKTVDGITGYKTRSLLVVPIRSTEGFNYGCIELLNSPWGFAPWMLLSAENIGTTLGGFIAERI
jgi:hypothetical protein